MTDTPDERPRPAPRPRPAAAVRPSPRPRVAGSRRDRDERDAAVAAETSATAPSSAAEPLAPGHASPAPRPASRRTASEPATRDDPPAARPGASRASRAAASRTAESGGPPGRPGRRVGALALVLALLCLVAAAGTGFLLWQRLNPSHVDASVLTATRSGVQALYAYDYRDSQGSVERKLEVLTGDLREQYENDLSQGGILDTYEQVSATTSYEVVDVGLQRINEAQDTATLVVFGKYVVKSATSGQEPAPEGSECEVSPDGAQACTQTVQVGVIRVDGEWKISEITLLTTS